MARELKIDLDISAALPPLTPEEWNSLSKNISEDRKVIEPLIVWKGRDIIVDGHHRWKAINEFGITDYKIEEKEFADIDEAIIWLLKHQKGRRNIGPNQLTVLIGKAYERRKQKLGGNNTEGINQYTIERLKPQPEVSTSYEIEDISVRLLPSDRQPLLRALNIGIKGAQDRRNKYEEKRLRYIRSRLTEWE